MLMTGKEYLKSIRDGRVLYVGRERIADQKNIRPSPAARRPMLRSMTEVRSGTT